jgi:F-type H+-transporting ATPase subunit epsilon
MASLKVDVVSAEKSLYSGEAKFVVLPGESGELGILPGHTPLISRIRPGTVRIIHIDDSEEAIFVAGGLIEVQPNHVTVLSDTAIRAQDLDEAKALAAREKASAELAKATSPDELAVVEAELAMLAAQANAARRYSEYKSNKH